jgi:heat shock protein HslJ
MSKRKTLVGALAATMLVSAISTVVVAQDELDVTPEGVVWSLTSTGGEPVPAEVNASLYVEDGEANGNAGCNSFSGTYQIDGASLVFDPNVAVTLAICDGPAQQVEDAHLPLLATVASWSITGNELSLADEGGSVVLTYEQPTVDITLTDIDALLAELVRLDERITRTRQDVRSLNIPQTQQEVLKNAEAITALGATVTEQNVPRLRERVKANEAVLNDLTDRFVNLRSRVKDLEGRVEAIEEQLGLEATPQG